MAPSNNTSSISNSLSLNPPRHPVLIILAILYVFLGASWYSSLDSARESAGEHLNWLLLATLVALIFLAHLASSVKDPEELIFGTPVERRRRSHGRVDGDGDWGTSPWGVSAAILVVLVLVQFQSSLHDA
ncbi:hypothetical protein QQ045_002715 [Rhodiola kirilowii]